MSSIRDSHYKCSVPISKQTVVPKRRCVRASRKESLCQNVAIPETEASFSLTSDREQLWFSAGLS